MNAFQVSEDVLNWMPHRVLEKEELDRLHPPLEIPEEVEEKDIEVYDKLEMCGQRIAGKLVESCGIQGRRRK